jgi:ribosomal protein S3AE
MAIAKRKQRFFDVEIPLIGKTTQLRAFEIKSLNGKFMKYDLTRMLRGKSTLLQLQVKVDNEIATATPMKISLLPYFLKRMVRKGTSYIEDSFVTECKDAKIKIKPFLVARRKVSRAVRKALRNKAREELIAEVKNKTVETIFKDILRNDIQKPLSLKLKKIYPLSLCEIRELHIQNEVEKASKPKEEESKKKVEKPKTPEKEAKKEETKKE